MQLHMKEKNMQLSSWAMDISQETAILGGLKIESFNNWAELDFFFIHFTSFILKKKKKIQDI